MNGIIRITSLLALLRCVDSTLFLDSPPEDFRLRYGNRLDREHENSRRSGRRCRVIELRFGKSRAGVKKNEKPCPDTDCGPPRGDLRVQRKAVRFVFEQQPTLCCCCCLH